MFPKTDCVPRDSPKLVPSFLVALLIHYDFLVPIGTVRLRAAVAQLATMPEAAINKHGEFVARKSKVWRSWQVLGVHLPPTDTRSNQAGSQSKLCCSCVAGFYSRHYSRARRIVYCVHVRLFANPNTSRVANRQMTQTDATFERIQ